MHDKTPGRLLQDYLQLFPLLGVNSGHFSVSLSETSKKDSLVSFTVSKKLCSRLSCVRHTVCTQIDLFLQKKSHVFRLYFTTSSVLISDRIYQYYFIVLKNMTISSQFWNIIGKTRSS